LDLLPVLLGKRVDYGMLVKIFGEAPEDEQRKYSPATITAIRKEKISGTPMRAGSARAIRNAKTAACGTSSSG
jgi:hypothetical protein